MEIIWQRIKNFLKRLFPLTISRFDQEIQEIEKIQKQELKEIQEIKKVQEQELIEIQRVRKYLNGLERNLIRSTPSPELSFEVALTEHCDLNCAGCNHFSPLAEPEFADYEEVARDFARLSALSHGHARRINLLGGEPLLHPDLIKFLKMARENFPDGDIAIITNGVRLLNQPEEFWQVCKENKITIRMTKYPISLDYDEMEKRAAEYEVECSYYNDSSVVKKMNFYKLDVKGLQTESRSFSHCRWSNNSIYLQHGRLYTCMVAPTARHFSRYFGVELKEYPEDSIDIYQAESLREIMEFLAKPIPFCRYCMPDEARWDIPWHRSERSIEEWT